MAVIKAVSSKASIKQAIDYITKDEKTEEKLMSGINCSPETALEEMTATKELWGKTDGRMYKHFTHSYAAGEEIDAETAHKNALELVNNTPAFEGFEVVVATHRDKAHIHTHFIVNSVSCEDGHKLQWSKGDLQDLKERCNQQSREQGLTVPEKGKTWDGKERTGITAWDKHTYWQLQQAEQTAGLTSNKQVKSYVQDTALAVMDCRVEATSREDFIERMRERGYETAWSDNRKNITFTDIARQEAGETKCKVRNSNLSKTYNIDLSKESLEQTFADNARKRAEEKAAEEQLQREQRIKEEEERIERIISGNMDSREYERMMQYYEWKSNNMGIDLWNDDGTQKGLLQVALESMIYITTGEVVMTERQREYLKSIEERAEQAQKIGKEEQERVISQIKRSNAEGWKGRARTELTGQTDTAHQRAEEADTRTLVGEARAGIRSARTNAADSRASRSDREAERERLDRERKQRAYERKQKATTRGRER